MALTPLHLNLYDGIALGFFTTVLIVALLNKFGDAMFRKGVARPFYIAGHRLHHRHFLLFVVPLAYSSLALLILAGVVRVVWSLLWTGLGTTLLIAAGCLVVDMTLDYATLKGFRWGYLYHEIIYLAIPAYVFTDFLRLAV